jgi:hypothetical protein
VRKDVLGTRSSEIDEARQRQLWIGGHCRAARGGLLVWAWRQFELLRHGTAGRTAAADGCEEEVGRHLRLTIETLTARSYQSLATERLHLVLETKPSCSSGSCRPPACQLGPRATVMKRFWQRIRRRRSHAVKVSRARGAASDWRTMLKQRAAVAGVMCACWMVSIEARLVYLQVIQRTELVDRAERQQMRTIKPSAKRGDILDRRGHVLATSVEADSIYAVPTLIGDEHAVAEKLCQALAPCKPSERQDLIERLSKQRNFASVRRQVT